MADSEETGSICRLDKALSHIGYGTRRDVKRLLHSRTVFINGELCTAPETHIHILTDILTVDGEKVELKAHVYLMMNKCRGVVCANKDGDHQTVFDLIDDEYCHSFLGGDLHVVGRLDLDTEGLLLLTTDGALTHRLISPKTHFPKTYRVGLAYPVTPEQRAAYVKACADGLRIDSDGDDPEWLCQSAQLVWTAASEDTGASGKNGTIPVVHPDTSAGVETTASVDTFSADRAESAGEGRAAYSVRSVPQSEPLPDSAFVCELTICEGRYHQVKRMFAALGNEVTALRRVSMGELKLDEALTPGEYRPLSEKEISMLTCEA